MSVRFAHLHLHSEYSLVDSTIRIKGLVDACVRAGIPAVALTDDSNMFALVKFYTSAAQPGGHRNVLLTIRGEGDRITLH